MRPIATDGVACSVGRSVCRSDTTVSCAKTAEPIEMTFGMWTPVGPRKPCIRWGPNPPYEEAILRGKGAAYIVKYRGTTAVSCAKNAEPIEIPFVMWTRMGRRKHY